VLLNTASSDAWITGGLVDRLGGGDFIPFSELIAAHLGGGRRPSPVTLPIGDHRLLVSIDGAAPAERVIHVEAGDGVQDIAVAN